MTLKVNSTFIANFFGVHNNSGTLGTGVPKLDIFSGAMPELDNITFVPADFAAQKLGTAGTFSLQVLNGTLRFNAMPASFNASANGVATWFALYNPTTPARVIIGTITSIADGTGVMLIENVNAVTGSPINVTELGIRLV